ncbi:MAG: DNA repair protein RecO [Candidatus Saccharibacteria bacterium]|nr:DNA repair protein RecO [Candidatus Saccharibacteria bacterium]
MKSHISTTGIVLARTDYQEADRILTVLTPDYGKLKLMARGVRRQRSKLAGGIELFSVNNITYLPGKGEIGTLISSRMLANYGNIAKDIDRTMLGYELLKRTNRITEEAADSDYFDTLSGSLAGLDDDTISPVLSELWFSMQLLKITGLSPNLKTTQQGLTLQEGKTYLFEFDDMAFLEREGAPYSAEHIKILRLALTVDSPQKLGQVKGIKDNIANDVLQLTNTMLQRLVRI